MDRSQVLCSDDELSDDDFDQLLSELLQRVPPPGLVERIVQSVRHLPLPQEVQPEPKEVAWDWGEGQQVNGLLVHHEHMQPS